MKDTQIVSVLVGLEPDLNIFNIEEVKKNGKIVKIIEVSNGKTRVRCKYCNKYTRNAHDRLKPILVKYLDIAGYTTYLKVYKRRFNCSNCGKRFTEGNFINENRKTISYKVEQKILMDLKDYNLSLKYIGEHNNVSDNKVRRILNDYMKNYPLHLKNLPSIISFDEFKADTRSGKYAFIVNDVIHKKVLDILPSRKKDDLIKYFTHTENRSSVQYVRRHVRTIFTGHRNNVS